MRFRLPVSDIEVALRPLTGAEDVLLQQPSARTGAGGLLAEIELAVALAECVAAAADGEPVSWRDLPAADLDTLLLRIRQASVGDQVRGDLTCPAAACGERIQVAFGIEAFLAHAAPQAPTRPTRENGGWVEVSARDPAEIWVRLPTAQDIADALRRPRPEQEIARRCIRPARAGAGLRRRAERALEALAPLRVRELEACCPSCGRRVPVFFNLRGFCLRELREHAAFLYQDVDLLARRYHWSEAAILAMPSVRRGLYAEQARQAGWAG